MRMRKKKYLDERLASCGSKLISFNRENLDYRSANSTNEIIDFKSYFGNGNPIHLEIGCGKGQFVCTAAKLNPNINYIAVEKSGNVIVTGCECAIKENLKNVIFLHCAAEYLPSYIAENSIDRIYLNFSCPFPKNKYANHRLTSLQFLKIYKSILISNAEIHMKTDNRQLFEFSIEQLSDFGFTLKNISLDLHNSDFEGNIITEYEQKFVNMGLPIFRLEAYIK